MERRKTSSSNLADSPVYETEYGKARVMVRIPISEVGGGGYI